MERLKQIKGQIEEIIGRGYNWSYRWCRIKELFGYDVDRISNEPSAPKEQITPLGQAILDDLAEGKESDWIPNIRSNFWFHDKAEFKNRYKLYYRVLKKTIYVSLSGDHYPLNVNPLNQLEQLCIAVRLRALRKKLEDAEEAQKIQDDKKNLSQMFPNINVDFKK